MSKISKVKKKELRALRAARRDRLENDLADQGAVPAIMASIYNRLGGEDRMLEWADENLGSFYHMMIKLRPQVAPNTGHSGKIEVNINTALQPTALDGPALKIVSEQ